MDCEMKSKLKSQYLQQQIIKKYVKKQQRKKECLIIFLALLAIVVIAGIYLVTTKEVDSEKNEEIIVPIEEEKTETIETPSETLPELEAPPEKLPETPAETEEYVYSKPVPESKSVGIEYFYDAVFIGDSRTEGFAINNGLISKAKCYTHQGLKVDTIFTDRVINIDGDKVTIMEALRKTKFSKVYIMLGINETGWVYNDLFIKKYGQIIDEIRKINPESIIYVQSILPVSEEVSNTHGYIKNGKIEQYNSLIKQMAEDKKIYYLDVKQAVINEAGVLPVDAATDGIHLNKKYCIKWFEYLKNHVIEEN